MVSVHCPAGPAVTPQFTLATLMPELAAVRGCRRNAAGAGRLLCRATDLCTRPSFPCRANQAAPGDRRPPCAPAAGAPVRPLAPWPDPLAPTGRGRPGAAATLAGQHLE